LKLNQTARWKRQSGCTGHEKTAERRGGGVPLRFFRGVADMNKCLIVIKNPPPQFLMTNRSVC
jgi:hypothetical protein